MSLAVDEGRRRGRSKSPGRRDERYERPAYDTRESSYAYPEDDLDEYPPRRRKDDRDRDRDDSYRQAKPREPSGGLPYSPAGQGVPYPADSAALVRMPGAFDNDGDDPRGPAQPPRPVYRNASPPAESPYRSSRDKVEAGRDARVRYSDYRGDKPSRSERGYERDYSAGSPVFDADERLKFLPQKYSSRNAAENTDRKRDDRDDDRRRYRDDDSDSYDSDSEVDRRRYNIRNASPPAKGKRGEYDDDKRYDRRRAASPPKTKKEIKKEKLEEDLAYGSITRKDSPPRRGLRETLGLSKGEKDLISKFGFSGHHDEPIGKAEQELLAKYGYPRDDKGGRRDEPQYPPADNKAYRPTYSEDPRRTSANMLGVEPSGRERDRSRDRRSDSRPLQPPVGKMSTLSVNTGHHSLNMSLSQAPPSPLLESYHGTYQSMSPMPSPLLLAQPIEGLQVVDVAPLDSDDEGKRINRRARFHEPEEIAVRISSALSGNHRAPDTEPLLQILPGISHEEVMELRTRYKAIVKAGSAGKGVNVAKHIRSRLKDEDPNLMKACYAVALGKWESEAYWANFWYQGDKTRRELLIESLMGRTNEEINEIKAGFQDKKYGDSLMRCMKTELKEDKFKKAVLLALSGERMEEEDEYGRPRALDMRLVDQDVDDLRRAVKSEKGGETLMISIVVLRSDSHLKEVLKEYAHQYKSNFARDALKKSTNLVGEVLAHILNGVINKPVRDALLLHHALTASRKDELRRELLTSRLVRYHWDRQHMEAVKRAYSQRYGKDLQEAVKEATSGEWGYFCRELCITRMPNDVRRVERVQPAAAKPRERSRERTSSNTLQVQRSEKGRSRSRSRDRRRE